MAIRKELRVGRYGTLARLHTPLRAELLGGHDMGGRAWHRQLFEGLPTLGIIAGPGVSPLDTGAANLMTRLELFEGAEGRVKFGRKEPGEPSVKLWVEVIAQVSKGRWWGGRSLTPGAASF